MGIMKYSRLGDTFFEDKAKKINQALEKINAPYYQVCKKVRGSKANKDAFDISWRKRNITCDTDYPNATTTGEKVVMRQLEKHFGISLSLLNSDTPRAIKKSLDYQKAQQTILDNKIKARQERERAAAERKALRNAPKTKTPTKTTTTKSIPSSERNDNKAVASKNNEVFTEVDGNITYFYTETKNNRRRNHAKLNIATNRITYLNSAVPMYVKEFIKGYKSVNILNKKMISKMQESKSSPAESKKAVEEKKEIEETMRSVNDIVQKLFWEKDYITHWNLINFVNPITGTIKDKNNIKEVGKIKIEVGNMNDIAIKTMRNDFSVFIETPETNDYFYGRKSDLKDKDWLSAFKEAINEFIRDNIDKKEKSSVNRIFGKAKETKTNVIQVNDDEMREIIFEEIRYNLENEDFKTKFIDGGKYKVLEVLSEESKEQIGTVAVIINPKGKFTIVARITPLKSIGNERVEKPNSYFGIDFNDFIDNVEYKNAIKDITKYFNKRIERLDEKYKGFNKSVIKVVSPEYVNPQYTKVKATDFARKMGIEVNEMKPMNEPETKFKSKKLTSLNMLILAVKNLTKAWVIQRRADLLKSFDVLETRTPDKVFPQTTYLPITFGSNKYIEFEFREVTKNKVDYYTMNLDGAEVLYFKRNGNMDDIGNDINDYLTLHLPKIVPANPYNSTVETSKFVKSTRGSGGEYNPETTEIIKETPPIMIDEDEAAKFDKGLDELTKLLQQAMQG